MKCKLIATVGTSLPRITPISEKMVASAEFVGILHAPQTICADVMDFKLLRSEINY